MDQRDKDKVKRGRMLRLARRMERIRNATEGMQSDSGDPFALELNAKLTNDAARLDSWGHRQKRSIRGKARRIRNGFRPPRTWKSGKQQGIAILEKALIFMGVFRDKGLGFRDLQILMMITGDNPIPVQQAADLCGITYDAARKQIAKMGRMGILNVIAGKPTGGRAGPLTINLTKRGRGVMYALNRFNPKTGSYDRLVARTRVTIHTDVRLLQMGGIIEDVKELTQDI